MNIGDNVYLQLVAGRLGLTIGWIIPSVFILCVALSIAELTSSMPWAVSSPPISSVQWRYLAPARAYIISRPNLLLQTMRLSFVGLPDGQISQVKCCSYVQLISPSASSMTINDKINHSDSAQMIATGIAVGSDGRIILGPAPTFGIIIALLLSHAVVCPSGSRVLAKLSLLTATINGKFEHISINIDKHCCATVGTTISVAVALIVVPGSARTSPSDAFVLLTNNSGWNNSMLLCFLPCLHLILEQMHGPSYYHSRLRCGLSLVVSTTDS